MQASINKPGGLLLPFRRLGDESAGEPVGGSCAPLRIDDILRGLDVEEQHFALSPHDLAQSPINAFFSTGKDRPLALTARCQACQEPLPGPVEPRSAPHDAVIGLAHMPAQIRTAGKAVISVLNDALDLPRIEGGAGTASARPARAPAT